jgi:CopG family transcriptional regulator, nickel-responsive regulator
MKTERVTRVSVSLPAGLLRQLDTMAKEKGYVNRSLAVANMIRDHLIEHQRQVSAQEIAGTITLVYDHHRPHLLEALTAMQHDHGPSIISTLHVHLDHHNCLEVLVVRGEAAAIQAMADRLIGLKGVKHGKLTVTTTGKNL